MVMKAIIRGQERNTLKVQDIAMQCLDGVFTLAKSVAIKCYQCYNIPSLGVIIIQMKLNLKA